MKSSEIALGTQVIDLETGRLTGPSGEDISLRHQTREVLRLLAETPGEIVEKDIFFQQVWDRAHVSEDSLVQCIAEIRHALGDGDRSIVETIPGKGYRLNATTAPRSSHRPILVFPIGLALLLVAGILAYAFHFRSEPARRVVAVLPFHDVSPAEHRGLLGDPVSDAILAHLARHPELTVIARGSSFRFRDPDRDLREIGRLLGADYLVEGSLHFDGGRVAINAALVDVETNTQKWSDRIETSLDNLLLRTAEIGKRVAFQVEEVVSDVNVAEAGTINADAFLLYLQAKKMAMSTLSKENNNSAIAFSSKAVRMYPDEPWGHIGLAFALRVRLRFGWADDPDADLAKAIHRAETAVRLSPRNYNAYFALARVRMQEGNQLRAIEAFEKALALNPSSADAMNALAQSYFYLGENDRALEVLAQSARIDPLPSFIHSWMLAWVLWQDGQCTAADAAFAKLSSPPPEAYKLLSVIQSCMGESEAARAALSVFLDEEPGWNQKREAAIHEGVWTFDGGRERWLSALAEAGMPET